MKRISREHIVGVILAGGLSRRMGGGDKGLLPLGRDTMLREVVDRMLPQARELVLNANGDPSRFDGLSLPVVLDTVDGLPGPLAGVLAGMRWAAAKAPVATHVLTVSSDVPFLPVDLGPKLAAALPASGHAIAIASTAGEVHPVIGLWPIDLADDLEAALASGLRKVFAWIAQHEAVTVEFPMGEIGGETFDPFFNANTPAELDEARRLLELMRR